MQTIVEDKIRKIVAQVSGLLVIDIIVCWAIFFHDFCRSRGRLRLSHTDNHDDDEQEKSIEQRLENEEVTSKVAFGQFSGRRLVFWPKSARPSNKKNHPIRGSNPRPDLEVVCSTD